jgi:hypothetical protein
VGLQRAVLEVRRADLRTCRIALEPLPTAAPGQVLVRVERFGLTSNNVTYALFGERLRYWDLFPAAAGWGRVPAWGCAVIEEAGEHVFGRMPMASHAVVGDPHRHRWSPNAADEELVLRPLFPTAFAFVEWLAASGGMASTSIVISSASSKMALCIARQLADRQGPALVALTSAAHADFVDRLSCFSRVLTYEQLPELALVPTVFVDLAGSGDLLRAVARHLGRELQLLCPLGASHWEDFSVPGDLAGTRPTFFEAPAQIARLLRQWGDQRFQRRLDREWARCLEWVSSWLEIDRRPDLTAAWRDTVDGAVDPAVGTIVVRGACPEAARP